jgi:hypothetical protein
MILLVTAKVIPKYPGKAERSRCIWRGLSRAPEDARTSRHTTGLASFTVNERITDANSHHLDQEAKCMKTGFDQVRLVIEVDQVNLLKM